MRAVAGRHDRPGMEGAMSDWTFFRRVSIAAAVAVLLFLAWRLSEALLLLFGSVLIGLLFSGAADFVSRYTRMPRAAALTLVILLLVGIVLMVITLFGAQIGAQLTDLWQRLPGAIDSLEQRFNLGDISGRMWQEAQSNTSGILFQITSIAGALLNAVGDAVLLIVAGAFVAADTSLYRRGALKMFPAEQRPLIQDTMDYSAAALRQWLIGQLIAVFLVGTIVSAGLWYIGLPSPLALGLIAGMLEFVPVVGPILGAVPATLLALTIGLFIVVQALESNLITPLIQKRMVALPPVVTLFAILCFGWLFGPLGVLFATPLAVFLFVVINKLYVRDLLHTPTEVPGEKQVQQERMEEARAS
jgi:predicted PurR-regulated permease PerM